jgi:hypothetical protein
MQLNILLIWLETISRKEHTGVSKSDDCYSVAMGSRIKADLNMKKVLGEEKVMSSHKVKKKKA